MSIEPVKEDRNGNLVGAALLIGGTCIGAGMLGMPIATGPSGFIPALFFNGLCWLYMLATGLLLLEATLWMHDGANFLSISQRFLGRWGYILTAIAFLILYYCLETAYLSGSEPILTHLAQNLLGIKFPDFYGSLFFTLFFGGVIAWGIHLVDRLNVLLMAGLGATFLFLVGYSAGLIDPSFLQKTNWIAAPLALPVLFSAYGYHNIIPTLCTYLRRNEKTLRQALFWGTFSAFLVYGIWELVAFGTLGLEGLAIAEKSQLSLTEALKIKVDRPEISLFSAAFGFFALVTSLLGVGISIVDFLGDGLKISNRTGWRRVLLTVLALAPPFIFSRLHPALFQGLLGVAGGFGEAFLNGLLPISIVWVGRYHMGLKSSWKLPGGKVTLLLLTAITVVVILLEAYQLLV
jgi:tyrosine-specific transport protein